MSLEEAVAAQAVHPKKIMMDVYTSWCGPCKMLDKNTFQNPDVVEYVNENYYAVKFNAEGNKASILRTRYLEILIMIQAEVAEMRSMNLPEL